MSGEPDELPDDDDVELDDDAVIDSDEDSKILSSHASSGCDLRRKIEDRLERKRLKEELGEDFDIDYYDDFDI